MAKQRGARMQALNSEVLCYVFAAFKMRHHTYFLLLFVFLMRAAADEQGLVNTEQELVDALSSRQRVVLGSSITITKELPTVERSVLLLGHSKSCKQQSCYIDAQSNSRHITVRGAGRLFVHNLEFRNGKVADIDGGSILVLDGGYVEVHRATFANNNVNLFSLGGAVSLVNTTSAKIYYSTFINNNGGFGGAIGVSEDSQITIRNSVFRKNSAVFSGGGIEFLAKGSGIVLHSTFMNNSASVGGALTVHNSDVKICGGQVENNTGSLEAANVMSEEDSSVTLCRFSAEYVIGPSLENCDFCNSLGPVPGVRGDPHIRGPHGETYDFHGVPDATYCLISDEKLHLNMRTMAGNDKYSQATYIKELGLVFKNQTVWLSALTNPSTPLSGHQGQLRVNMKQMPAESNLWSYSDRLTVSRTRNQVTVEVPGRFRMVFRIVRAMYRIHGPGSNFLNLEVAFLKTTDKVDGVFGQLYQTRAPISPMDYTGHGKFKALVDTGRYRLESILSH